MKGSIAAASFADALAVLRAGRPADPHTRPAIDTVVPARPVPDPAMAGEGSSPSADRSAPSARRSASGGRTATHPAGPLLDAARAMAEGQTSSAALVASAFAAIDKHDDELGGIVAIDRDQVEADAARLDAERADGRTRSVLHGIPITVKDVIDVAGLPTRAGSDAYLDHPVRDAEAVRRLREAGAIVLAKVATHEFALGVTSPQSRNPHDPTRIPGGSSGGSAVAVATGMGLGSIGTDTRASIRVPAALSGVVGLKATYGRVPTSGVVSLSWTMDHVAPMATTVADAVALLDVMAGTALAPSLGLGIDGLRIGVAEAGFAGAQPGVTAAVRTALGQLADAGAVVGESPGPSGADLDLANAAGLVVSRCEAAAIHRSLGLDRSRYWEEVADQLDAADGLAAVDYLDAQRARTSLLAAVRPLFDRFDLLAMPTSPVVAPPADDFARYLMVLARNAIPWSFLGCPAISVPCGSVDGLPVGLQLVAPWHREDLLVRAASLVSIAA